MKKPSLQFGLALLSLSLTLSGCASGSTRVAQGPTGEEVLSLSDERESYLIPPEIPSEVLTLLFRRISVEGEILAISITSKSANRWTLEVTTEKLPSQATTRRRDFARVGKIWREE